MAEKALEEMLELIKCPVCWQGPQDPHQCPRCSKPFCHVCIGSALHSNGRCPFCRYRLKMDDLVRCPWLDDVRNMAEKAGESLRKCSVHTDQLMTHFDVERKRPACQMCSGESVETLEEAKKAKQSAILSEIESIEAETKVFWENQVAMKRNYENFSEFGTNLCTELSRVLSDQTNTLEEHMNSVRNALNEIKVLIPKKLVEEVTDAAKNRVYEFLTDEWSGTKQDNSDTKFMLTIEDIRQLELETSPRHSETMKVGDRDWFVDVGLLNVHKVGGWESDDVEHLSVIIWQDEATRGTMPPPMSALITAKDANDDLVEVVLFEKFNDLRGFGRRLFLPFDQLISYGTTTLNIEVVLGRQSPSFSLKLLRRMIAIAKKADERMRQLNLVNKRLHEKAHRYVKQAIDEVLNESLPSIASPHKPSLPQLDIDEMVKTEPEDSAVPSSSTKKCDSTGSRTLRRPVSPSTTSSTSNKGGSVVPPARKRTRNSKRKTQKDKMMMNFFAGDQGALTRLAKMPPQSFNLRTGNRRSLTLDSLAGLAPNTVITVNINLNGGKGGFGSLLRAIGSQIERTTDKKSMRNLDGKRIRTLDHEKTVEEQRKRKIEQEKELEIEREKKIARKVEKAQRTVEGQVGGKHYFEDSEYLEGKKETTETTAKSVQSAAKLVQERAKKAEEERKEAERLAEERRQQNGGVSSDESGSDLEDEFMPKRTQVITGPNLASRQVTANAKTQRHNAVMWSHMCGKNYDQVKKVEIIKYEDISWDDYPDQKSLEELGADRLTELLMLRALKTGGSTEEKAARLLKTKELDPEDYPAEIKAAGR